MKKNIIRFIFSLCIVFSTVDCVFLFLNGFMPECLFLILLPLASIGVLFFYNKRTDDKKEKEHSSWLAISIVALVMDFMILYLALGYDNKTVIIIMEFVTLVLVYLVFKIISINKFKT